MVYSILILGIALIIFSLIIGKKESKSSFEFFLEKDIQKENLESFYENEIVKSYIKLEDKVVFLEEEINNLKKNLEAKDKDFNDFYENIKKDIKIYDVKDTEVDKEEDNINNKVLALYNEGKSVDEIASTLKIGKGEILLRIGLQKKEN